MKTSKKIFSLALALVMALGMAFSFTLKTSATGPSSDNGTITITNAAKNETYKAYQVFGATYDAATKSTAWTIAADSKWKAAIEAEGSPFTLTAGTDDTFFYVDVKDGATDTQVLNWIKNVDLADKDVAATKVADGDNVVFNVPYGYYLITSTVKDGAVVTIDKVNPAATVIDKNENEPHVGDKLKKILVNGEETDETTAKVGDTVKYKVTVQTTVNWVNKDGKDPEQVENYTLVDTPNHIAIKEDTVAVTVGGNSITNFTKSVGENGVLTVSIPWISADGKKTSLYNNGDAIVVTYDAQVLPSAVGTGASTNRVGAFWNTSNPIDEEDETVVYNYKFDIKKYDATDDTKTAVLAGAKFELYGSKTGTDKVNLVKVEDETEGTYYRVATPEEAAKEGFTSDVPVTDANGYFQIKGLSNGTYWLEETEAPKGFNKMTERKSFVIEDGDKIGSAAIEVPNSKGKELPSTGGMGTTIFYTVGGILVVGAAVLLITKKRMDGAQ